MHVANLLSARSHLVPGRLKISELYFRVPLDHDQSPSPSNFRSGISKFNSDFIRLFGRSVERAENSVLEADDNGNEGDDDGDNDDADDGKNLVTKREKKRKKKQKCLPWLVYLQGGPGFGCSAPQGYGFTELLLDKGYKVS